MKFKYERFPLLIWQDNRYQTCLLLYQLKKWAKHMKTVFRHCTTDVKISERRKNNEVTPNGCTCFPPGSTPETIVEKENPSRFQNSCWVKETELAIQGEEAHGIYGPKFCKGESDILAPEICMRTFVFAGEIPWDWAKNYRKPVRWTILRATQGVEIFEL